MKRRISIDGLTSAEAVVIVIALDRLIRSQDAHIVATNARAKVEAAIVGEPWPEEVDPALTLGNVR